MADTPERLVEVPQMTPEMGQAPESGASGVAQEQVQTPESYLEKLEKNNVQVRADDFTQPVMGDQGQQLTTPIPSTVKTVTIPANQQQLLDWAKGDPNNSLTWLAKFWIRKIKQAVHKHWHLIMPQVPVQPVQSQQMQQPAQQTQPLVQDQSNQQVQSVQVQSVQQPAQ